MLKWQLLSELLNCSMKMVALRSSCGAINDARLQCLEALKLAIKLQALSQYVHMVVGTNIVNHSVFLLSLCAVKCVTVFKYIQCTRRFYRENS